MGLFSFNSISANYYWIGGTGVWSDVSHWSDISGGVALGSLPGIADNVVFDANSGLASVADIVTMDVAVTVVDYDFSLVSNGFTIASVLPSIEIRGSLSSNGLASITWNGIISMNPSAAGSTILSNGTVWNNEFQMVCYCTCDNFVCAREYD